MKLLLVIATCFVATCLAEPKPAINEIKPQTSKPGRFLSLPIPEKCASRKFYYFLNNKKLQTNIPKTCCYLI